MKENKIIAALLALFLLFAIVPVVLAGTVSGYDDNRENPTTNFALLSGNHLYAEYTDEYIRDNHWNFSNPVVIPNLKVPMRMSLLM